MTRLYILLPFQCQMWGRWLKTSMDLHIPIRFSHIWTQGILSEITISTKSRNKSKEPLYRTLLYSTKGKVMKLLMYNVWGRISAHGELLKTWVNFYIDLRELSLVRLCLILNPSDCIAIKKKKKKKSKLHIVKGKKSHTNTVPLGRSLSIKLSFPWIRIFSVSIKCVR